MLLIFVLRFVPCPHFEIVCFFLFFGKKVQPIYSICIKYCVLIFPFFLDDYSSSDGKFFLSHFCFVPKSIWINDKYIIYNQRTWRFFCTSMLLIFVLRFVRRPALWNCLQSIYLVCIIYCALILPFYLRWLQQQLWW